MARITKAERLILENVKENQRRKEMAQDINNKLRQIVEDALETKKFDMFGHLPKIYPVEIDIVTGD